MKLRELFETPVSSSWITDITLMTDNSGNCVFATVSGNRYRVEGLGEQMYNQWIAAPSKGQFFNDQIRDQYQVVRLI